MSQIRNSPDVTQELVSLRQTVMAQQSKINDLSNELIKFKAMFEGSSDAIFLINSSRISDCNAQACRIWRSNREDIIGKCPYDFAPDTQPNGGNSRKLAEARIRAALKGVPQRFYWRDRRSDGTQFDTEVHLRAINICGEEFIVGTVRDITAIRRDEAKRDALYKRIAMIIEKRSMELELEIAVDPDAAETRYRQRVSRDLALLDQELENTFESDSDGLIITDSRRNILKINASFSRMTGYIRKQAEGGRCYQVFTCKGCSGGTCVVARMLLGQERATFDTECYNAQGEKMACQMGATALHDSRGRQIGMVVSYRNITEYKEWVEALRHSEELHRITLASISDAVFITDDDGFFYYVSSNVVNILGCSDDEALWRGNIANLLGDNLYSREELEQRGELSNIELKMADVLGRERILIVNVKKVAIQTGTVLVTCRDITEKRLMERESQRKQEQLEQADKMVSLGILVSGIAHEINNPNNYILLNSQLLSRIWTDIVPILDAYHKEAGDFLLNRIKWSMAREKMPRLLAHMEEGAKRIKNIVTELKNYSRHEPTDLDQVVFINSVVKHSLTLLNNQIKGATDHFNVDYCHDRPKVRGNSQKIGQVIINLVINACEALPDHDATIDVKTMVDTDAGRVLIVVRDTGSGIQPEDMPHITDPFFTTKRSVGGTGLGLPVSAKIVQEHGGTLDFSTKPGSGTTATLSLPMIREEVRP